MTGFEIVTKPLILTACNTTEKPGYKKEEDRMPFEHNLIPQFPPVFEKLSCNASQPAVHSLTRHDAATGQHRTSCYLTFTLHNNFSTRLITIMNSSQLSHVVVFFFFFVVDSFLFKIRQHVSSIGSCLCLLSTILPYITSPIFSPCLVYSQPPLQALNRRLWVSWTIKSAFGVRL